MKFLTAAEKTIESICKKASSKVNAQKDSTLLLFLSAFYFVWRILTLPLFEFGGDAVWKWRFLRYYHETGIWFKLIPEHHQGRWAQNIPVLWLMNLFDSTSMWVGAVFPILCGFAVLLLMWFITRRLGSRMAALEAWISTMLYFVFFQESAQLLPSLPCTMFTLLAIYLFLLYLSKPVHLYLPMLAGLAMGLAWGSKVTACYWCAAFALFLMFFPVPGKDIFRIGRMRIGWDVVLFSLGFLAVFVPETFVINNFFHVSMGRVSMLGNHVDARLADVSSPLRYTLFQYLISPFMIFLNFSGKIIYKVPFCLLFVLILPPFFLQLRSKGLSPVQKFLPFTLLAAALIHCYLVVRVFPFQHPERPLPRYFLTLACVSFVILYTAPRHLPEFSEPFRVISKLLYRTVFLVMIVIMFIGWINDPLLNGDHLFNKIHAYQCIRLQKENNLPFLLEYEKNDRFSSRTFKLIMRWKIAVCNTEELSDILSKDRKQLEREWGKHSFIVKGKKSGKKTRDKRYALLCGPKPVPGTETKCIVAGEYHAGQEMLLITEEKENN